MQWMYRLQRNSRLLLLALSGTALLWFAPLQSATAQMFSAGGGDQGGGGMGGGGMGGMTGDPAKQRMDKKKKGTNITEWVRRLHNDRPETRFEAVKSLGDSKDPKAIEHLVAATEDVDIRVKVKAIEYLGNLHATDATPVLSQQLFRRDVHPAVKQKILIALGKIGDPRGAEPIVDFLKRNLDAPTKGTALFALREVGNNSTLAFLDDFAQSESSPPLRQLAADAATDIRHRLSPEFTKVVPTFIKQVELRNKAERGEEEEESK